MGRAQEAWGGGVWPEGGSLARRLRPGMRGKERRGGRCRRHQRRDATPPRAQAAVSLRVVPGPGVSVGGAPPRASGTESSRLRGFIPAQGATLREPSPGQTPRCEARRGWRCGAIVDEPQQSRWPPTPCAQMGCRGTAPPAVLSLLDDALRHRQRRDALHLGLRPARDLWRDASALGCVARSAEEDDAGGISDETRHRHAPRPRRPSGLPLGRASPLAALLPVLPARNRRAFADPSRPREQRAESP